MRRVLERQSEQISVIEQQLASIGATTESRPVAPPHAAPRLVEDVASWQDEAQPGELAFHKRPNDRSGEHWERLTRELWERYGFASTGYEGKRVIDIGAGSRLRTLYFTGAEIVAIEPLADEFRAEVPWHDLDKAEAVYSTPAEAEIPELVGTADLVVSINALDHGFNFEDAIKNIAKYLNPGGSAFLSFDQHHTPDKMHPLVLTDPIVREVFDRCGLSVARFEEKFRYHGGPGPQALNYWLVPQS